MKKSISTKLGVLAMLGLLASCQSDQIESTDEGGLNLTATIKAKAGSYIVTYNDSYSKMPALPKTTSKADYQAQSESLKQMYTEIFSDINLSTDAISQTYGYSIKGFAANLTEEQVRVLLNDPRVKSIEEDGVIALGPGNGNGNGGGGGGGNPTQTVPYGTTRVGGGNAASSHTAWVIDTGIDQDHPDLNVDTARSLSFLSGGPSNLSPDDYNGHGTHVAGTIAAIDNSIGSLGVAPGTTVVAVRVLDRRGSGSTSGVIAGVDYVGASGSNGDVANMSLGGGVSTSLDNAVLGASSSVKFALAAGNESDNALNHSPARVNGPNIYTISAMNSSDNWASFSNYGSPVDYCAPGVSVYSLWKDGGYNTISGTSMAAPHAAGVLLLGNPSTDGYVNGDPDGNPDPIIHN